MLNKPSKLITGKENVTIFKRLRPESFSLSTGVVQLFATAAPHHTSWNKIGAGVICFVRDVKRSSFYFQFFELKNDDCLWEQELYIDFTVKMSNANFLTFEADKCMIGLNFASSSESKLFYKSVIKACETINKPVLSKIKSTALSKPAPDSELKTTEIISEGYSFIGRPKNFVHISHVGYDENFGFDLTRVPPEWIKLFSALEIPISLLKNKNASKCLVDFVEDHGGIKKIMDEIDLYGQKNMHIPSVAKRKCASQTVKFKSQKQKSSPYKKSVIVSEPNLASKTLSKPNTKYKTLNKLEPVSIRSHGVLPLQDFEPKPTGEYESNRSTVKNNLPELSNISTNKVTTAQLNIKPTFSTQHKFKPLKKIHEDNESNTPSQTSMQSPFPILPCSLEAIPESLRKEERLKDMKTLTVSVGQISENRNKLRSVPVKKPIGPDKVNKIPPPIPPRRTSQKPAFKPSNQLKIKSEPTLPSYDTNKPSMLTTTHQRFTPYPSTIRPPPPKLPPKKPVNRDLISFDNNNKNLTSDLKGLRLNQNSKIQMSSDHDKVLQPVKNEIKPLNSSFVSSKPQKPLKPAFYHDKPTFTPVKDETPTQINLKSNIVKDRQMQVISENNLLGSVSKNTQPERDSLKHSKEMFLSVPCLETAEISTEGSVDSSTDMLESLASRLRKMRTNISDSEDELDEW